MLLCSLSVKSPTPSGNLSRYCTRDSWAMSMLNKANRLGACFRSRPQCLRCFLRVRSSSQSLAVMLLKSSGVEIGPVSRKSRRIFPARKSFVKLRPPYSLRLVLSYVVEGIKIKITVKFRASRRLRFEDTEIIMSLEFWCRTFEKEGSGDS